MWDKVRLVCAADTLVLLLLAGLLGQKYGLDVRENTALGDGYTLEQFVELLVIADSQLQVTRVDSRFLVVASGVSSQLQDLSCQVFHDGGQVDRSASTNAVGIVAFAKVTVDSADGELQTSSGRAGLCLALSFASFTASRHVVE